MKQILIPLLIILSIGLAGNDHYRLSFRVKFDAHGKVLLIIPFRIYFNAAASVELEKGAGQNDFRFVRVDQPGYMARTMGFGGRTLGVFTADYHKRAFLPFSSRISRDIQNNEPYYGKYINKIQRYPFDLVISKFNPLGFTRSTGGIHDNITGGISVKYRYPGIKINTYFRIYEILTDVLLAFNHRILPTGINTLRQVEHGSQWQSQPLDFSPFLNKVARKTARIMKLVSAFRQERTFTLSYTAKRITGRLIISGRAKPGLKIWQNFSIKKVSREIIFNLPDYSLLLDKLYTEVKSDSGNGGMAQATLRKMDF